MADARPTRETDVLVVGAGPGGYVAAIRAAQCGLDVLLADDEPPGGTCLNYGCIPSKALLSVTGRIEDAGNAESMGVYADPYVDVGEMVAWKDGVVDRLTGGIRGRCEAEGVATERGRATFLDANRARIDDDTGSVEVAFDHAVVATGSRPIEIPNFGYHHGPVLDSRESLSLDRVPDRLVVVGAGYVGMELATVFARLGSDVTVVEQLGRALPTYGAELTRPVQDRLERLGVTFAFGEQARDWRRTRDGIVVRTDAADGGVAGYPCDRVLVAVGREPVTDTAGLDALGLEPGEGGFLGTDANGRTAVDHVFAVGDVAGEPMLAHSASHEGVIAAETIAGLEPDPDSAAIPAVVYTEPEIATVGMTEADVRDRGAEPVTGRFPVAANGRALTTGHSEGFVRLVAEGTSGRLVGGAVVGPEAAELIGEIAVAIECSATLDDVLDTVHPHPTLSEAVHGAAAQALGRSIHTANR